MSDYNMIKSSSGIFLQQVFEGDSCVNNEAERCSVSAMNKHSKCVLSDILFESLTLGQSRKNKALLQLRPHLGVSC